MDDWVEKILVGVLVGLLILAVVCGFLSATGVFNPKTDDGVIITDWKEVTPPHEGLRCWQTGGNADNSWGWCEPQ